MTKTLTDNWIWRKANQEAEQEYRYQRDPYEFAMKHLWEPRFQSWSTPAYYAFGRDIIN